MAVAAQSDNFPSMEPLRLTDYLAAIPSAHRIDLLSPNSQLGTEPFLKFANLVIPGPISDHAFHQRAVAEFSLLALMVATAIVVATVILNWSR